VVSVCIVCVFDDDEEDDEEDEEEDEEGGEDNDSFNEGSRAGGGWPVTLFVDLAQKVADSVCRC